MKRYSCVCYVSPGLARYVSPKFLAHPFTNLKIFSILSVMCVQVSLGACTLCEPIFLCTPPHTPQDLLHVLLKAHVKHLVSLVEDGIPDLRIRWHVYKEG